MQKKMKFKMKWIKINESSENPDTIEIDTGLKGNKAYEIL